MPKELTDYKRFVQLAKRNDKDKTAKNEKRVVYIKNPKLGKTITKFKLRYSRYLYTFKTDKKEIAKRLKEAFTSSKIESQEVKSKKVAKKKTSEKK